MKTILALQPQTRHIGYAVFEGAELIDWGVSFLGSGPIRNRVAGKGMSVVRTLIERHSVKLIVLPTEIKTVNTVRNRFLRTIRYALIHRSPPTVHFSRRNINQSFKSFLHPKRVNRDSMMRLLATWFPELLPSLPRPKRLWESKDYWVPMFDAVALVVTWHNHNK